MDNNIIKTELLRKYENVHSLLSYFRVFSPPRNMIFDREFGSHGPIQYSHKESNKSAKDIDGTFTGK